MSRARRVRGRWVVPHITPKQELYLRRLLQQAFVKLIPTGYDSHHLNTMLASEASIAIDRVKRLLAEHAAMQACSQIVVSHDSTSSPSDHQPSHVKMARAALEMKVQS